jgi:hypothetical protein
MWHGDTFVGSIDQALAHAVQCLQVELIDSLGGHESHRRALNRLGDRPEMSLLAKAQKRNARSQASFDRNEGGKAR